MTTYLKWIPFFILFCTQVSLAQSNEKLLHIDSLHVYPHLNHYLSFCETDITIIEGDNFFEVVDTNCFQNPTVSLGSLLNENYISKISLRSTNKYPIDVILSYGGNNLFTVNAVVSDGELIAIKRAGLFFNRSEKDVKEGNEAAISLKLLPNKIYHIYSHIGRHYSHYAAKIGVNLILYPIGDWHKKEQKKMSLFSLFIGLMLMLLIFVLFFYFNTPRPEYLFYILYIATPILGFILLENMDNNFFFPENRTLKEQLVWLPTMGAISFYILFVRHYIDTPKYAPVWDKVVKFIVVFGVLVYTLVYFIPLQKYPFIFKFFSSTILLVVLYTFISSIVFFVRQPSQLRFYLLLGTCLLVLSYLAQFMNIEFNKKSNEMYIVYIGTFLESLIFAMGLAYKMGLNEKEKVFANQQQALLEKEKENLKELNQLKSGFFANISHEFRTPLTLILAPLEKFKQTHTAPSLNDLGMMHRYARRLHQLINQVLDLSRIEAGKMKLSAHEQDVVSFLQTRLTAFQSMAENKSIDYKITLPDTPVTLFFDDDKLEKIINNLLSNAFKFTADGGKISVRLRVSEAVVHENATPSEKCVVLTVQDNGVGISPSAQQHVFERFYQVDRKNETLTQGTGIGLALVKDLVNLHYGHIDLKSEKGKGSTFCIYLPMGNKHLKADEIIITPKEKPLEVPSFLGSSTVPTAGIVHEKGGDKPILLLVEDNVDLQNFISQSLFLDYQLLQAFDGEQGLEMAKEYIPDLIISDIMMPKMDGLMMTKQLKKDTKTSHIPLILLTAKVGQQEKMEGLKTGAIDYLAKPFDIIELNIRIQSLIKQVKAMQAKFSQQVIQVEPTEMDVTSIDNQFIQQLRTFIESHIDNSQLSVEQMAAEMTFSRVQFYRKLKGLTGIAPSDFLRLYRLKRAKQLIKQQYGNMAEIAYATGFSDPAHFSKSFKKEFGVSPSTFTKL